MSVEIVAVTKGVGKLAEVTPEEIISYIARVSNPNNQLNFATAAKLLGYCLKHKHYSIFEHSFMTMEIKTSRAIAAQILRHRSFVFQEFSQRYAKADNFVAYEARSQDTKNRQNSIDNLSDSDKQWFKDTQAQIWNQTSDLYEQALAKGIAKECARFFLPLNTETTLYMTGNIRSWIHYIELRCDSSTQKEHRDIALAAKKLFCEYFNEISIALEWI